MLKELWTMSLTQKKKKNSPLLYIVFFLMNKKGLIRVIIDPTHLNSLLNINNETIKGEKIIKKLLNVTKIEIYMMLILPNVMMELLNEMF